MLPQDDCESDCEGGRTAAIRGQLPKFSMKPVPLRQADDEATENQGHFFWACVQGLWWGGVGWGGVVVVVVRTSASCACLSIHMRACN